MRESLVTVMRDRYVNGWPRHEEGEPVFLLPIGKALERVYRTDAHFAAYPSPNGRRLTREALDELPYGVELTVIVFDVDCQETHGSSEAAPTAWRVALRDKMRALAERHPDPYYYETRGGARIVYRQYPPTDIFGHNEALEWSQSYAVAVAYMKRCFDIECDPACGDWQRLFRLPRATREPGGHPENWPTMGDANAIGALEIEATSADVATAQRQAARLFQAPRAPHSTFTGGGDGLLFFAIKLRGDIVREAPRGGWVCICPNRAQHTKNSDGTDSTVVYPANNGEVGFVCCRHAHCTGLRLQDWLALFSESELAAARRAAGIEERNSAA